MDIKKNSTSLDSFHLATMKTVGQSMGIAPNTFTAILDDIISKNVDWTADAAACHINTSRLYHVINHLVEAGVLAPGAFSQMTMDMPAGAPPDTNTTTTHQVSYPRHRGYVEVITITTMSNTIQCLSIPYSSGRIRDYRHR